MNNHILFGCAGINSALLLNYCLWFVGASSIASWVCVPFVLFGFLYLSYCVLRRQLSLWPIPVFLLALLLISLSTPAVAWDARSIWLFHAKRIFFDENLFAQLDNYAPWSHNDYPVIIPVFSASLAGLVGLWNEIFPKAANVVFLVVPIFLIGAVMQNAVSIMFFLVTLIYVCSHYLHNGFVDASVAIIMTSIVLVSFEIQKSNSRYHNLLIYILSTSLAVLCLVKNEGVLLSAIFLILFFSYNYLYKILTISEFLFMSVFAFVFSLIWKYYCYMHSVKNDLINSNLLSQALVKIFDLNSVSLILNYMFNEVWIFAILALILVCIIDKKSKFQKNIIFTIIFVLFYVLCIFFVYISTPQNLNWHLDTSASRVLMSANVLSIAVLLQAANIICDRIRCKASSI